MKKLIFAALCCLLLSGLALQSKAHTQTDKRDLTDTTWEQTNYSKENTLQDEPQLKEFGVATRMVLNLTQCEPDKSCRGAIQVIRVDSAALIRELPVEGTYDGVTLVLVHIIDKAKYGYDGTETLRLTLIEQENGRAQLKGKAEYIIANSAPSYREVVFESDIRLPVIFLPGVAGTVLTSDRLEVWPLAPAGTRANLGLEPDGITRAGQGEIGVGPILRSGAVDFYGIFLQALTKILNYKEGEDLFAFGYDWRLSNDAHYSNLDKVIETALEKSKKKKVILAAHSMGGVIARGYIYSSPQRAEKVASLITMGTPYWGAPKVYYGVTSGYQFGNPFVRKELMKILLQNCPSAYQLLPQSEFITDKKTGQQISLDMANTIKYKWFKKVSWGVEDKYDETPDNELFFNPALMKKAREFFAAVGKREAPRALPGGVKQYAIIGTGVSTVTGFLMEDWSPGFIDSIMGWKTYLEIGDKRKVIMHPQIGDGDGTVPLWSLETAAATANYYVPHKPDASSAHGDLPANPTVLVIALSILKNKPVKPQDYPRPPNYMGIPITPGHEAEDNTQFELHSDAHLRITNSAGKALGFNSAGGIDESLAGTFLSYEGVEYASISDMNSPLNVSVDGIHTGKFTLNVKIRRGGKATSEFLYKEVPVVNGTKTQFTFTPATMGEPPSLSVRNGNESTLVKPTIIDAGTTDPSGKSGGTGPVGDDGQFMSDIPSVGGTVTSFRFFTTDEDSPPPQGLRDYQTRFSKAALKVVYYEFSVKYAIDNAAAFNMAVTWTLNGRPFARQDMAVSKPRDWATSSRTYGHGHREPGKWEAGKYKVTVEVDGRRVAANTFVVY